MQLNYTYIPLFLQLIPSPQNYAVTKNPFHQGVAKPVPGMRAAAQWRQVQNHLQYMKNWASSSIPQQVPAVYMATPVLFNVDGQTQSKLELLWEWLGMLKPG